LKKLLSNHQLEFAHQKLPGVDIETYCQIVTALSKTIELQKEIDKNYEGVED